MQLRNVELLARQVRQLLVMLLEDLVQSQIVQVDKPASSFGYCERRRCTDELAHGQFTPRKLHSAANAPRCHVATKTRCLIEGPECLALVNPALVNPALVNPSSQVPVVTHAG